MNVKSKGPSGGLDANWYCCVAVGCIEKLWKEFMCCDEVETKEVGCGLCIQRQPLSDERVTLFSVEGDLNHGTFDVLDEAIRIALDNGCFRLVLDLSRISDVSPSGIDGVIQVVSEIQDCGGGLVLLNPCPAVSEVLKTLEALGLTKPIRTFASVEEAMDYFSESSRLEA